MARAYAVGVGAARGTIYLGDFHPHLEAAFAQLVRELAPSADARGLEVVVANRILATHLRRRAAELGASTLGLRPRALEDLTRRLAAPVLAARGQRALAGFETPLLAAELLAPVLRRTPESYFAAAAQRRGLFRVLAATFRDLRDALVTPADLAAAVAEEPPGERKLRELAELYGAFVEGLEARRLADDAAVSEAALAALAARAADSPLLLYGIYDLVGRQRALVEALARGRETHVFFPWRDEPAFAYTARTRDWLESLGLESRRLAAGLEPGDLQALRAGLFADPRSDGGGTGRDGGVSILSVPTPAREAREALRRLVERPARSAAILLRHEESQAAPFREAERAARVALHRRRGEPWAARPAGRVVLGLLRLAAARRRAGGGALPRAEVEDLLASGGLREEQFPPGSYPGRWAQLFRRRGLIAEVAGWRRFVERFTGEPSPTGDDDERDPVLQRELRPAAQWAARLLETTERLARDGRSWRDLAAALDREIAEWVAPGEDRDGVALALLPLARLDGVLEPSFGTAQEAVEALLAEAGPGEGQLGSAPTVGELGALRGLTFDRVVIPGLVERSFPRRARQDPVLLDAERARLSQRLGAARALPLKMAAAAAEERLLFRLAVGAARRELLLSYPRLTDAGTPQVASSFLLAAERALGAAAIQMPLAPPYPRPEDGPPLVPWEFDLREIDAARAERDPRRAAAAAARLGYLYDAYPRFASTVRQHRQRSGAGTWRRLTEFDGMIDRHLAAAFLERRSSGGALRLSPTALERYARCGFQFLQRDVLRLESAPAPERSLDLEPRDLGKLYHALLRDLYLRLQAAGLLPLAAANLAAAQGLVTPTLDALLAARPHLAGEGPEALFAARRRKVAADVERLLAREAASSEDWVPADFEWSFAADEPAVVELGGGRLAVRGRIDRLDERGAPGPGRGSELRIVDYKSGRAEGLGRPGDLKAGRNLQLALYRRAVRARRGDLPVTGALLPLQGEKEPIVWSPEDFAASDAELEELVAAIVGGMGEGAFFQIEQEEPHHYCDELCEFGEICGPGRRSLIERKSHDPAAQRGLRWRGRAEPPPQGEEDEA